MWQNPNGLTVITTAYCFFNFLSTAEEIKIAFDTVYIDETCGPRVIT